MTASRMWARVAPLNFSSAASHCLAATARCLACSSRSQVRTATPGASGNAAASSPRRARPAATSPVVDHLRGLPVTGRRRPARARAARPASRRRAAARSGAASIRSRPRSSAPPATGRRGRRPSSASVSAPIAAARSGDPQPGLAGRPCARARASTTGASAFHASAARPACSASTALLNALMSAVRKIDGPGPRAGRAAYCRPRAGPGPAPARAPCPTLRWPASPRAAAPGPRSRGSARRAPPAAARSPARGFACRSRRTPSAADRRPGS